MNKEEKGNKKKFSRAQIITINALLCAIVMLFVLFPISIGTFQLAFIPIIAVIISAEFLGWKNGLFTGLFFGVVSLVNHFIRPGLLSFAFYNPLISILPRILIGAVSYAVSTLLIKHLPRLPKAFSYGFGAALGVCTNTVGVMGMMLAFYHGRAVGSSAIGIEWVLAAVGINFFIELAVCTVITPPIVLALKKFVK